jgi:DNA-binding response OmpR family regulator
MKIKLLLVDGDMFEGVQLLKVLQGAGFETAWIRTEEDALALAAHNGHHALIIDVDTFASDRHSLVWRIRNQGSEVPLLALTAMAAVDHRVALLEDGADDCLVKPVHLQELIARTRVLVRRAFSAETREWRCGCITFIPLENRVEVSGTVVQLTPREFALLSELAHAKGRVVPRQLILERIYGMADAPTESAIEYLVHKVRQKIGSHRIRTVASVGYAFVSTSSLQGPDDHG